MFLNKSNRNIALQYFSLKKQIVLITLKLFIWYIKQLLNAQYKKYEKFIGKEDPKENIIK